MKFRGGYSISLDGRPSSNVRVMPEPEALYLPLVSTRFKFSSIKVEEGAKVDAGDVLATDPDNYDVPLLSPRTGTVRLSEKENHIVLENISKDDQKPDFDKSQLPHVAQEHGEETAKCFKLLNLGAWQYFYDAYTGKLPDPAGKPQAIIVSLMNIQPFVVRGDVQLKNRFLKFTRGLENLQSLIDYQAIYLAMPDIKSELATKVREHIRGHAWAKLIEVPLEYTRNDFNILARHIGLKRADGPIWAMKTEGLLAVDRALTLEKAVLVRLISVGGPAAKSPEHIKVMAGYPISKIVDEYAKEGEIRIVDGGFFKGKTISKEDLGVSADCRGYTFLPEHTEREFLGWLRPGSDRSSYSNCFASALKKGVTNEKFTTTVRGEKRACVSCGFCEEVCPAGITPYLIHKYIYSDMIEQADAARVDLCIKCGLCSFVCPSKIELREEFIEMQQVIEKEKAEAEALRIKQQQEEEIQKQKEQEEISEETLY